jgi:threonine synthase
LTNKTPVITLGEGGTPLIKAEVVGSKLGMKELYVKDESRNPTLSFKDRKSTVAISKAAEFKAKGIVNTTAGNAGASVAAYAAKAGLPAYIFTFRGISTAKLAKLISYGPRVFRTRVPPKEVVEFAADLCAKRGLLNVTASSRYNPYSKEGAKTALFEVYESMGNTLPDVVIIPVGTGGNLSSYFKGLKDLRALGLVEEYPRLIGVQAMGCAPLVEAFERRLRPDEIPTITNARTIAHSILDDWPPDGDQALLAIRETKGVAISVTDKEILNAMKSLSADESLYLEPASASPLAALRKLLSRGDVHRDERVLLAATGSGSNQPDATIKAWGTPATIELDMTKVQTARDR